MIHRSTIVLIILFSVCFSSIVNADPIAQYDLAQKAYLEKNYNEAQSIFLQLFQEQPSNGYLAYNIGNTYYKQSQIGEALQYFEKAVRLIPRFPDLRENLNLARSKVSEETNASLKTYLAQTFYFWASWMTVAEYQLALIILSFLFWSYVLYFFVKKKRMVSFKNFIFGLLFLYLVGGYALKAQAAALGKFGIIVQPVVDVKASFVDENFIFQVREGAQVQILDVFVGEQKQVWVQIMSPNGQKGWVSQSAIGII